MNSEELAKFFDYFISYFFYFGILTRTENLFDSSSFFPQLHLAFTMLRWNKKKEKKITYKNMYNKVG